MRLNLSNACESQEMEKSCKQSTRVTVTVARHKMMRADTGSTPTIASIPTIGKGGHIGLPLHPAAAAVPDCY